MKSNGAVIYRGPSQLDGQPIVVIAIGFTTGSANSKTGNMIQTHILREAIAPTDAIKTGNDVSICGQCVHRGDGTGKGRTCYVNVGQGPLVVWRTYQAGKYPVWDGQGVAGRIVRLGTYGDPAAVPAHIWEALLIGAVGHTGYTHQWRTRPELRGLCMASADSADEAAQAQAMGWRTYRVALPNHVARTQWEAICPASAEAGKKLTCAQCRACDGMNSERRGSIVIQAHGGTAVMANVRRLAA
jgi:hypothetical protein